MSEWVGISGCGGVYLWVYVCVGRCSIFLKDFCVYHGLFFLLGSLLKFLLHFAQWKIKTKNITDFVRFFFILPHETQNKKQSLIFSLNPNTLIMSQEVCGDVTFFYFFLSACSMNYCIQHWLSFLELCIWCAVNALHSILLVVGQACRGLKLALCSFGLIWPVFPPWALVFSLFLQHGGGAVGLYAWGLYCSEKSDRKSPLFYYHFLQCFFFIFCIGAPLGLVSQWKAWWKATPILLLLSPVLFLHFLYWCTPGACIAVEGLMKSHPYFITAFSNAFSSFFSSYQWTPGACVTMEPDKKPPVLLPLSLCFFISLNPCPKPAHLENRSRESTILEPFLWLCHPPALTLTFASRGEVFSF